MTERNLHPTILKFKDFVKRHPKLVNEVRGGEKTWQELYEDWYLFGEEDEMWGKYRLKNDNQSESKKENNSKSEFMTSFFSSLKNIDMNQMQQHITNASNVITTIQNVIQQFQGGNSAEAHPQTQSPNHPFSFRKD